MRYQYHHEYDTDMAVFPLLNFLYVQVNHTYQKNAKRMFLDQGLKILLFFVGSCSIVEWQQRSMNSNNELICHFSLQAQFFYHCVAIRCLIAINLVFQSLLKPI